MGSQPNQPPLVVIVGQTASGKSALALDLAQRFDGEIIAADSRTVYRGMDIGTAKPSTEEQALVRHHLIDVVDIDQPFTVAEFQKRANTAITNIAARHKLPIMVGGTGLYIDAVLYNFTFRPTVSLQERAELEALSVDALQARISELGLTLPTNERNPRHLVRTLEAAGAPSQRTALRPQTLILGLELDRALLEERIKTRVDDMVDRGFVQELRVLSKRYGWECAALQAPGYRDFRAYLAGDVNLEDAMRQFVRSHMQYARRQKTWFKRNPDIHWISQVADAVDLVTTFLNK